MWPTRTISFYLAREVLLCTLLAFLEATPVILLPNVFKQLGDFAVVGITFVDVFVVLGWVFLLIAGYALPIAFVFGLLLAMGRLHGDREISAMRACGLGTAALVAPVVGVAGLLSIATAVVSIGLEHHAWKQIEATKRRVLARGAVIEPGHFIRFGKRMILAQDRLGPNRFQNIMIEDEAADGRPLLIFAETAEYVFEYRTGMLRLILGNGDLRLEPYPNDRFDEHRVSFASFDYSFPAPWLAGDYWLFRPNQLSFAELRRVAASEPDSEVFANLKYRQPRHYRSHMHRMLAVPLIPILFGLFGVPLTVLGAVRGRARGVLLALLLLAVYYGLFIFTYDAARAGRLPAAFAVWSPNALVFAGAVLLLLRVSRSPM